PVVDRVLGPVVPAAGNATLDGLSATDFARSVEVQGDPVSGRGRIERQQILLGSVLQQAIGSTGLLDFRQLLAVRPALGRALATDSVGLDEALSLARSLQNLEADGVTFAPVPTGAGSGPGSVTIRGTDAAALFSAVRADSALPPQTGDA